MSFVSFQVCLTSDLWVIEADNLTLVMLINNMSSHEQLCYRPRLTWIYMWTNLFDFD